MELTENYLVEKSNVLNEIRRNNMTLQELRFLSIYLSKINARDESTRVVSFPLDDFRKIMDLGRLNLSHLRICFEHLLQQVITMPNADGTKGFTTCQIFKRCKLYQDNLEQWQVEIDANDDALPLMFKIPHYVKYELWNALRLSSCNQLRMYEILKQYQSIGTRTLDLVSLKELLGLNNDEYPRWTNFKARVLDSCQQALQENTDICFTYEPIKVGRKFTGVRFFIHKNENYVDQLMLDEFIGLQSVADESDPNVICIEDTALSLLSEACKNEFDIKELEQIQALLYQLPPDQLPPINGMPTPSIDLQRYHYLMYKYANFCRLSAQHDKANDPIQNRFGFFISTIKADLLDS